MEKRIESIVEILRKRYRIKPWREEPFRVLIGVVLSHRTKDEVNHPANERLFARAKDLEGFLRLSEKEIAKIIYPVGFYNQKAKRIKQICRILKDEYNGKVPKTREELMKLPGVGGKSADIVLLFSFGEHVIPVDTHVSVISRRWHLTESENPERIREDLHKIFKGKKRMEINNLLVEFGKEFCTAMFPKCRICPVLRLCPYESKNL